MRKVLVILHVPHEGLGLIGPALKGFNVDCIRVYEKSTAVPRDIGGYKGLIVMGGPMGVYEADIHPFIRDELILIESALKSDVPTLGVCLGSQLLAKAAGADVYKGKSKEIGWYKVNLSKEGINDRLFTGLPDELTVFQWHGDTFDVPPGGANLAASVLYPNQVIRVGRNAYGIQFHLEVTEHMIYDWLVVNKDELKALKGRIDAKEIVKETPGNIETLHRLGRAVISRFSRLIDP